MSTATSFSLFETGKATMDLARNCTLKLADGVPADKTCHQPVPNSNHVIWVLGHLACTDDWFAASQGNRDSVIDESWGKLFGMGSTPTDDATAYPSLDEIKAALERARQTLLEVFEAMDEKKLKSPVPDELKPFAPTYAAIMSSIAWHEGFHSGQLSAVRRSLGLPHALEM
jgi:uncharacterized damage-inducible protein DinB